MHTANEQASPNEICVKEITPQVLNNICRIHRSVDHNLSNK
mgnify:CR=1 FL=1